VKRALTTLGITRPARRAGEALYADQVADPFDARLDSGFSVVRSSDPVQYVRAGRTIRTNGFETNAIVQACARVIADQVGTAWLEAYRMRAKGAVELALDTPLQSFLDQPAPQLSGFAFRRTVALHLTLYGNAYAQIVRRAGRPERLRLIHPERVQQIVVDEASEEILAYVWNRSGGAQVVSPWTDILHARDLLVHPDLYFGFPRGLSALFEMQTDDEASVYVRQILSNSGVPAIVFFARQGTSLDELKRAEAAWHERMVQRGERGRTRFLGGVEQMQVVGHTLKDLEFPSLRQISREDICAAFGVDPRLIGAASAKGNEGGLSGSQYQEARRRLEQQTCHPLRIAIQDALDQTLTPEFGQVYARFSPDAINGIVETPTELAERVAVLTAARVFTLEEARRAVGQPEAMDPAHTTEAQALRTVKEALEAGAMGQEVLKQDIASNDTLDDAVDEAQGLPTPMEETRVAKRPKQTRAEAPVSRVRRGDDAVPWTRAELEAAWSGTVEELALVEEEMASAALDVYGATLDYVLSVLAAASDEDVRSSPWWERFLAGVSALFAADGPIRRLWSRRMRPIIERVLSSAANRAAAEMGADVSDTALRAAVDRRTGQMTDYVVATTLRRLNEVIAAGRSAGMTATELRAAIQSVLADAEMLAADAARLARTEAFGALNEGEWIAARAGTTAGTVRVKAWLSERDERVRVSHVGCDAAGWIDVEAAFPNGLQYPHDPAGSADEVANCRCVLRYADRPLEEVP
jgi:HK97 family phage portal protein